MEFCHLSLFSFHAFLPLETLPGTSPTGVARKKRFSLLQHSLPFSFSQVLPFHLHDSPSHKLTPSSSIWPVACLCTRSLTFASIHLYSELHILSMPPQYIMLHSQSPYSTFNTYCFCTQDTFLMHILAAFSTHCITSRFSEYFPLLFDQLVCSLCTNSLNFTHTSKGYIQYPVQLPLLLTATPSI